VIPKTKIITLTGKSLRKLNESIAERENNCCALCKEYVEPGTKAHHEPQGALKSDEYRKMILLCTKCHYKRHHTAECKKIKEKCIAYLANIIKSDWRSK